MRPDQTHFRPGIARPFFGYGYQMWIFPGDRRMFALLGVRGPGDLRRSGQPSNPARGTSFLLIEKVSMRGHFYRTDREDSSI